MKQLMRTAGVVVCILVLSFALTILHKDIVHPYEWMIAITLTLSSGIALFMLMASFVSNLLQTPGQLPLTRLPQNQPVQQPPTVAQSRAQSGYGQHNMPNRDRSFEQRRVIKHPDREEKRAQPTSIERAKTYQNKHKPLWNPQTDHKQGFKDITQH